MTDPVSILCPECASSPGDACRDRAARAKPTCAARWNAAIRADANAAPDGEQSADPTPAARTASVRSAAGSSAPTAAANAPATAGTDFDDSTPPPRSRPRGLPLPRVVTLPPGEDVIGIFGQWDGEGRIPAGSVLCDFAPFPAFFRRERPAYQVIASGTGAEREPDLDGYRIVAEVRRRPSPAVKWVVMVPIADR